MGHSPRCRTICARGSVHPDANLAGRWLQTEHQPIGPTRPGVGADMRANVTKDDFEVVLLWPGGYFPEDVAVAGGDAEDDLCRRA